MDPVRGLSEDRRSLQLPDRRGQLQLAIHIPLRVLEGRARHDSPQKSIDFHETRNGGKATVQASLAGLGQRSFLSGRFFR